jgi:glycerol-3-phosphate dehydrogenase
MTRAFDAVVIGAGIHGAGAAQALAAAGCSVLVLEQTAPAAGSSSRSSKLVHGGLRYLESARFGLVREALAERERLLALAPDLVRRVPFFLPVYRHTHRRPWRIAAGLMAYAALAGWKPGTGYRRLAPREWDALDGLDTRDLQAVFEYPDAQTDDAALTRAVLASARSLGAELLCPAKFVSAQRHAQGCRVYYEHLKQVEECEAGVVVNAAGPWVNHVLANIDPLPPMQTVEFVQGTHIVLDAPLRRGVYYVEAPRDRRAVFVMPWKGKTLVGTTETAYRDDPLKVAPLKHEIDYLHETAHAYFPSHAGEIVRAFAGLRVLPTGRVAHFHRSRETVLSTDAAREPRLVTIYGGKLTTYRSTAQKVLDLLRPRLPARRARADTAALHLIPV